MWCASCLNYCLAVIFACDSFSFCVGPAIAHAHTSIRSSVVVETLSSIAAASCRGGVSVACAAGSCKNFDSAFSSFIRPHALGARFAEGDEPVLWLSLAAQMWAPLVDEFARAPVTQPVTWPRAIARTPLNRPDSCCLLLVLRFLVPFALAPGSFRRRLPGARCGKSTAVAPLPSALAVAVWTVPLRPVEAFKITPPYGLLASSPR